MTDRAVADSTCVIALDHIGQLALLPKLFASVMVPPAVVAEVSIQIPWLEVRAPRDAAVVAVLKTQLDEGEAAAIALAMELGDASVILDDKKARRIARQVGLTVIGTIGLLLRAKRLALIPAIRPLLTALEESGFRMTDALRAEALRLAGEDTAT